MLTGSFPEVGSSELYIANCLFISTAARTASSADVGKSAITASPIYLSIKPLYFLIAGVINSRYLFKNLKFSSGDIFSDIPVKFRMSENKTPILRDVLSPIFTSVIASFSSRVRNSFGTNLSYDVFKVSISLILSLILSFIFEIPEERSNNSLELLFFSI